METPTAPQIGDLLAGYRLESTIGVGGMGVVFRAEQSYPHRLVAIKVIAPAHSADAAFRSQFIQETESAAAIENPHVIPIYDAGESNGLLYLVMRYVAGSDLRTMLLRGGPPPASVVSQTIEQVSGALDAASSRGIVHRDVKPANILLEERPGGGVFAYLCDFGLAKLATASELTMSGALVGTVDYMSPEQIRGEPLDGRADQYALGCVAYQLLTGVVPFSGPAATVMWAKLNSDPPPIREHRPDLPAACDRATAQAMEQDRDRRHPTCAAFAAALQAGLEDSAVVAAPRRRRAARSPTAYAVGAVVLLAALVAVAYLATRPGASNTPEAIFNLGTRPALLAAGRNGVYMAQNAVEGAGSDRVTRLAPNHSAWSKPLQLAHPAVGLTVGRGSLWVLESAGAKTVLQVLNPTTGTTESQHTIASRTSCVPRRASYTCRPLLGRNVVWIPLANALVPIPYGDSRATVSLDTSVPVPGGVLDAGIAGDRVWALTTSAVEVMPERPGAGRLRTEYTFPSSLMPRHIVATRSEQWVSVAVSGSENGAYLEKLSNSQLLHGFPITGLQRMDASGASLWVGTEPSNSCNVAGQVRRLDLLTGANTGEHYSVSGQPTWIAQAGRNLWVTTYDRCSKERSLVLIRRP